MAVHICPSDSASDTNLVECGVRAGVKSRVHIGVEEGKLDKRWRVIKLRREGVIKRCVVRQEVSTHDAYGKLFLPSSPLIFHLSLIAPNSSSTSISSSSRPPTLISPSIGNLTASRLNTSPTPPDSGKRKALAPPSSRKRKISLDPFERGLKETLVSLERGWKAAFVPFGERWKVSLAPFVGAGKVAVEGRWKSEWIGSFVEWGTISGVGERREEEVKCFAEGCWMNGLASWFGRGWYCWRWCGNGCEKGGSARDERAVGGLMRPGAKKGGGGLVGEAGNGEVCGLLDVPKVEKRGEEGLGEGQ